MVWLNWICALFFFMLLALPGCRGATWTEEDERLARERNLGRIISRARNTGRTLGDFTSSKPFGYLSSRTRGSSPRTLGGFVSSRPSSGSVQSPLSQVLRGSSSRVKFGGFSSDGFPSSQTSSSVSQTSDRSPTTRTSSSATRTSDPLSQVLRGSASRVKFGGFSSDGFPSSQTSNSASKTSDRFPSTRTSSSSSATRTSDPVLRGSSSRVKFGGFSSDGFPSSQTSSSVSQTSVRSPTTRTSSSATRTSDPLSQVLRGSSSRVTFGGFSSDGFPSSPTSSSASLTSDGSRTTARKPSQGSISSSVSSQRQGSSAASSQRQGSSPHGSSQRQGPSASYIPNFIGRSRGGFVIPQNIHTVYQNSFQTSSPRNSGPFQRPSQSFTDPISGSQASTDRISGSFQVSQIMDKSSQTSSTSGCLSCHLVLQGQGA